MTLPRGASRALYAGNGQAVEFPFLFKVWEEDQLSVLITAPDGATTQATGWTARLDDDGGAVRYLHEGAPLPCGWKLAIVRDMPFEQEVDLVTGTRFDPEVIETALDMAAAERQQLLERLGRAVVVEPTDERGPEALISELRSARDTAVSAAAGAAASSAVAEAARGAAAGRSATASAQREAACLCAQRAEAAAEAAQTSADLAKNIEVQPPTAGRRGGVRVGRGLELVAGADGVADVLEPVTGLVESATGAATSVKTVELAGFTPYAGARLSLTLAEANTAEAPALSVNGGEALPIVWGGAAPAPGQLAAGVPWPLLCDGEAWRVTGLPLRPDEETFSVGPDGSLRVPAATAERPGLGRPATAAEVAAAETGENGPAWVTPEHLGRRAAHLVETWHSADGTSGYRKWSDGWVEQWYNFLSRQNYVTFLVPFANTNYVTSKIFYSTANTASSAGGLSINSMTTTGFRDGTDGNGHVALMFWGYAAE